MRPFTEGIFLKYSEIEHVEKIDEIKHPILREVLKELGPKTPQIEITTLADIPSGTGLGSSGSFTTSLIKALFSHYRKSIHPKELAELASDIEINRLKEPIGKQDQYISAYGGITEFHFRKNGKVDAAPLKVSVDTVHDLEDNLLLFYTGQSRAASSILKDQVVRSQSGDRKMIENLHFIKELGLRSKGALLNGDTSLFGQLMDEHWQHKKNRTTGMSNDFINAAYEVARKNGAVGGKVVGAGGGGFLMLYADDREKLRHAMKNQKLQEVRFTFDFEGTKVILS
jgi:D-glycero-alpha-D-manno-heptose-7-phosphate kinase